LPRDFPRLPEGTVLNGKYRILSVAGSGGMGHVYRAIHVMVHRQVAIKTLVRIADTDHVALDRFQQEARIAGALGHDNICEVLDFGVDTIDDTQIYYTVMPFLEGMSLGRWLQSSSAVSPHAVADIFAQVLLGLQAAHDNRIVHRDLKPDNIFITTVGDRPNFVKLLDFGISKYMNSAGALELTRTGIAMGTPLYMPPEQARGERHIDHRADIYAAGVVLYEALVGMRPYGGHSYNEILVNICTQGFPRPSEVNPAFPPALEVVILRAMARNPADRYESAAAMRTELLHAVHSLQSGAVLALSARKDPSGPRSGGSKKKSPEQTISDGNERSIWRHRQIVVLAIVSFLLLLSVGALLVYRTAEQHKVVPVPVLSVPPPPPPEQKSVGAQPVEPLTPLHLPPAVPPLTLPDEPSVQRSSGGAARPKMRESTAPPPGKPAPSTGTTDGRRRIERDPEEIF
jgi:serine/threonine-protein kinase